MSDASFNASEVLDQRHYAELSNDLSWAVDFFKEIEKTILPIAVVVYIIRCSTSIAEARTNYISKVAGYHASDKPIRDYLGRYGGSTASTYENSGLSTH